MKVYKFILVECTDVRIKNLTSEQIPVGFQTNFPIKSCSN